VFQADLLSIIRSLIIVFTAIGICHTGYVDCPLAEYSVETSDDEEKVCPKNFDFFTKIKLRNIASCWVFIGVYHDSRSSECQIPNCNTYLPYSVPTANETHCDSF